MNELHIEDLLEGVVRENPRFTLEGYLFVREALDYAVGQLETPRHISGEELLLGVREYALSQFGPMARRVLMEWGITSCEHIGEMVFLLVDAGLLGKTEEDRIEDFKKGYDFKEAFDSPFKPSSSVCL